jgi:valyl-tRNA synthetase
MSKSKGNVIDPLEVTEVYGVDALRFTLSTMAAQARDVKLDLDRVAGYRGFANKIWNATRFVLMNVPEGTKPAPVDLDRAGELSVSNRWILHKLDLAIEKVTGALDSFRLDEASSAIYGFLWHTYCDWSIELAKPALREGGAEAEATRSVLLHVLDQGMRLLHPIMPFITEEIWTRLPLTDRETESVMIAPWPTPDPRRRDAEAHASLDHVIAIVEKVRTIRGENGISPKTEIRVVIDAPDDKSVELIQGAAAFLEHLARVTDLDVKVGNQRPAKSAVAVAGDCTVYMPLEGLVDLEEEVARLEKAMGKIDKEIAKLSGKLSNERFIANAPPEVVAKDRARLAEEEARRATLAESAAALRG